MAHRKLRFAVTMFMLFILVAASALGAAIPLGPHVDSRLKSDARRHSDESVEFTRASELDERADALDNHGAGLLDKRVSVSGRKWRLCWDPCETDLDEHLFLSLVA